MRKAKFLSFLAIIIFLLMGLVALPIMAAPPMQGGNVLRNPSFDKDLSGWIPWYYENIVMDAVTGKDKGPNLNLSFYQPSFLLSEYKWDRETHGKDEDRAAGSVSGRHYTKFRAGFFQPAYVAPGSRVVFTVWVNGFCEDERQARCPVRLRAGIDPYGGTDWRSPNVHWVEVLIADQEYKMLITPEVQAPNGLVTVFLWGEPHDPVIYNAAYFDDANLVVTVPPTPTGAPPTAPPSPPTPTPCAQMRVVSETVTPDSTLVAPGTHLVKTWRVQNSGTCAWFGTLNFVGSGNRMGNSSPIILPLVQVGQSTDIDLDLIAPPEPGAYQGTWEARTGDGTVLGRMIVTINVMDTTAIPRPAQVVTPSPVASAIPGAGKICVLAFKDRNGDGQQAVDEDLLAGAVFALSNSDGLKDTYTTDAAHEPHCFSDLQPAIYTLSMEPPPTYRATSPTKTIVILLEGMTTDLTFGAVPGEPVPTSTRAMQSGNLVPAVESGMNSTRQIALTTVAVLVMFNLALVVFVSVRRR